MCSCINIDFGSQEQVDRAVRLPMPKHMEDYGKLRNRESISVDGCIAEEILHLWSLGITTYGCCCGHNKLESMVNVSDADIPRMLEMGYVQNHPDPNRKDTFKLKTA